MLYIMAILLGIVVGIIFKGRISNILNLEFEKAWIIIIAFLIQAAAQFLSFRGFTIINGYILIIQGLVIILLLTGFWYNRKYLGIVIISLGFILNALVMMTNGGKMPVSYEILKSFDQQGMIDLLAAGRDSKHVVIDESTRLSFLSDVIYIPYIFGYMMRLASIGDLVIVAGVFIFVTEVVSNRAFLKCHQGILQMDKNVNISSGGRR